MSAYVIMSKRVSGYKNSILTANPGQTIRIMTKSETIAATAEFMCNWLGGLRGNLEKITKLA